MTKYVKDFTPVIVCLFLSFTQLKVLAPFINVLVVMTVGLVISFFYYRRFYNQAYISWMYVYLLVMIFNNLMGDYYFSLITNVAEEICVLLFPAAFTYYIITQRKIFLAKVLSYSFFALIIYSSIATCNVDMLFPGAVRESVALLNTDQSDILNLYYGLGMVTYKFTHSLPVLIPALVFAVLRSNKKNISRFFAFITLVAVLLLIYVSYSATAFLLAFFALLASLLVSKKSARITFVRLLFFTIFVLLFIISLNLIFDLNDYISSLEGADSNIYADRLLDVKSFSESGEATGDLGGRIDKYSLSVSAMESNIIWGTNLPTGEHSAMLDRLACLGLLGWIPYVVYIIMNTITQKRWMSKSASQFYIIGVVIALLMLTTKNMSGWDMWFMYFCLMPVLLWFYSFDYETLVRFMLPNGILDYFEIMKIEEEITDEMDETGTVIPILHIYLDERDLRDVTWHDLQPNGFTEPRLFNDFLQREHKILLHVRRRLWLDEDGRNVILESLPLVAEGTCYSVEFADFLKKMVGHQPSDGPMRGVLLPD